MKKILLLLLFACNCVQSQYSMTPAFPNLGSFATPTEIANAGDGTNRLFVSEATGKIFVFKNNPLVSARKVFIDLAPVLTGDRALLLGLTFHPNYKTNKYFYVHYVFDSAGLFWLRLA